MNKVELSQKIAEKTQTTNKQAEDMLEAFMNITTEALKAGLEVSLTGFGTFMAKERSARTGVNPQNPSQKIQIAAVKVPKFKAGKALKDALKK
jgi:DNA-binding protein HU-beta